MDRLTVIKAYTRLVELERFSAVADDLRVKQSTVSKWIAALEDDLGVQLVDRTTRSLRITDAGQQFYRRATEIVASYESAVSAIRHEAADLRGRIRMSVPVVFGQRFITPAVTTFLIQNPNVELELVFGDGYVNLVEEGFDIAIRVGVPVDSALRSHPLGEANRRLVASPNYVREYGKPKTPRDLEKHQCLVHTKLSTRVGWSFSKGGKTRRVSVGGRIAANHSEAALHMAKAGLGVAMLASWLVDAPIRNGELVALLSSYALPPAPIRALTPPGRLLAPRVRALIEHLRESLAEGRPSPRAPRKQPRASKQ